MGRTMIIYNRDINQRNHCDIITYALQASVGDVFIKRKDDICKIHRKGIVRMMQYLELAYEDDDELCNLFKMPKEHIEKYPIKYKNYKEDIFWCMRLLTDVLADLLIMKLKHATIEWL